MAEKAPHCNHDADSGVVSEQPPTSPNDSPIQREGSPPIQRQNSHHSVLSFNQLSEGVVVPVYNEARESERSSDTERAGSEENAVIPMLETQGPPSLESSHSGALFTIGPSLAQEESGGGEPSASALLLQEAQKLIGKETREQKAKLSSVEARLKQTEAQLQSQLQDTKDQLAEAKAKTVEVERNLYVMTKKKDEAEQKLAEVEKKREKELKHYNSEVTGYKEQLALLEQKNETQRCDYEGKIKKLTAEMEEKKKSYDKTVLELTKETCDLKVQVANMKAEEQSLKRKIAELQRDMERQARENLAKKFDDYKSSSENSLADKEAEIQKLQRLLSEASINSNSSQDTEKSHFKFSKD